MNARNYLPEDIIKLIISRETGQASNQEEAAIKEYLEQHPGSEEEIQEYVDIMRRAGTLRSLKRINTQESWARIEEKTRSVSQNNPPVYRWLKYAAVMIPFVIGLGLIYLHLSHERAKEAAHHAEVMSAERKPSATLVLSSGESLLLDDMTTGQFFEEEGVKIHQDQSDRIRLAEVTASVMHSLRVPRGGEYQMVLSDGTTVWVNSESQLDYPTLFDQEQRMVSLEGEAYFEVTPDDDRPFIVKTPDMQITVKGTSFNIHNYMDHTAEATVVSGSIAVSAGDMPSVELAPGQQARLLQGKQELDVHEVDVNLYISWVEGMFRFRNMPLDELAYRVQRWYDVDIDFLDHEVAGIRLTGAMEKERPVEYLIYLIERSAPLDITVANNTIRMRMSE